MLLRNQKTALLLTAVALFGYGCFERQLRPVNPCTTSEVGRRISIENVDTVDLLFMVDNSNSMSQEQGLLIREVPRMVSVLASGDRDADGMADFTAVRSMHVGIVTSDMGAGNVPAGETVPSCDPGLGDDGVMRNTSTGGGAGCMSSYPSRVFNFDRGVDDPASFGAEIGCVANLGTGGCGFEQQLEASLKALSPAAPQPYVASFYAPVPFYGGTVGHGDDTATNGGFLRPDSALAIVLLTDEEDCSVPEYNIFYPNDPTYAGNGLNLRCSRFDNALYPVDRYINGFRQLRENPSLLIYAPIVGIPADLAGASYETMLADTRLIEVEDTVMSDPPIRLLPSCDTENGIAFPPRRIIEVARGLRDLGASTTVQSICAASFTPAIDVIIEKIADALSGACLPRALNQSADGTVGCNVYELLPAPGGTATVTTCAAASLDFVGTEEVELPNGSTVTRELCVVPQVTPADGETGAARGWYYDNRSAAVTMACSTAESPQRIAFSDLMPPTGAEVRLNCNQAILPSSGANEVQLGTFCDPSVAAACTRDDDCGGAAGSCLTPVGSGARVCATNACAAGVVPSMASGIGFTCDTLARTCGVACTSDADCGGAGLLSYVCDNRTIEEVVGGGTVPSGLDPMATYGYCVNPTCGD